ncbi:amino acid adenylation domain-containing protein, partial [Ralstonia nicotianae]
GIWQTLLGVERVGRHDDFFALGGHSLQAVRLVAQVRTQLGAELGLTELFAQPSLSAVAQAIVRGQGTALPAITVADRGEPLPLSFAQQRLWFLAQMEGGSEAYHIPVGLRLKGELDEDALRRSLDRIVARHEALRTRFVTEEGQAVQRVASADVGFALDRVDLQGQADREQALATLSEREANTPFDLAHGPLIRGCLVKLGEQEHVLLITMHHIVSDGWSQGVLARELGSLYEAYRAGNADPLPALPIQYADYAVWQRRWLEGGELQRQGTYWEQALAGAPTLLSLPTDRARPAQQDYAGGSVEVIFDETLSAGLRKLSQRHGTTLFMTVLAGWSALLSRLSGQEEVVVGSPVANRTRSEVEGLIGFFVNTLALRVEVGGATVSELLGRVKSQVLEAQAHQDLPFEQVVERVRPVRSLSHSPVFQAALSWLNTEAVGLSLELEGLTIEGVDAGQAAAKFDLTLELRETSEGLAGSLDYATALFDRETVERYLGYLQRLLAAMVENDSQQVSRIALLDEDERVRLLESWNETAAPYPEASTIHGLFEAQVRRTPEAIAVEHEGQQVSYAELNARANRVAHALIGLGVGPDARVGLCAERSVELVVGLLGILKAGGGYVPLDPSYPQDRLAYMLEDSAPVAVLAQSNTREQLGALSVPVLDLDGPLEEAEHDPQVTGLEPHHLAYVIYTSGSTGCPKGVMNEHRGVVNRLWWAQQTYRLDASDRVLQKTPFGFDVSVWELFWPLLAGARLVMARPEGHKDPAYLAATIEQAGITTLHFVPSMLQLFLDQVEAGRCQGLRRMLCSGEALPHALQQRSLARFPHSELHNLYGPTEAAIDVTAWRCNAESHPGVVPIGRPIANTQMYVLDGHQQPVPLGVTGEIYIGGAGVARGYLNRPELTAERFVVNPFHGEGRERMYRTGDLGRWLPDGSLAYQGRADAQVKLRGFRIELGEIEARLLQCAGVSEAVVAVREDVPGEQRLVAYHVSDEAIEAQTLREQLQASLPEYMVPAAYVRLEHLPLTPNGKLDRKGLPAPDGQAYASTAYEAPQGEVEQTLAGIWQTLLGVERVGRHDDFFALGGHSLQAVRLVAQVRTQLGAELGLTELFAQPSLSAVAQAIVRGQGSALPAITVADRGEPLPLSFAQQRLWFLAQMEGGSEAYHIPVGLRLKGALDEDALRRSLDRIVARHEALRTCFEVQEGQAVQRVASADMGLTLDWADLSAEAASEHQLGLLAEAEARAAFDLEQGPLIRGRLVKLGEQEHVLLITMHHIVSDGWSQGVLARELGSLYEAYRAGNADPLPALPIQYADYAVWQRRWLDGAELQRQGAYWEQALAGAPTLLSVPTDRARPPQQDYAGGSVEVIFDEALSAGLRKLSQRHGTTLFMTVLAGWSALLSRLSGQEGVVVGSPVANRTRSEVEGLIGFFVNTLALRVEVGSATVSELLGRVKSRVLEAQAHQDLPFEQVVERVRPVRSLSHSPVFQAALSWLNTEAMVLKLDGLTIEHLADESYTAKFDLSLALREHDGRIAGSLDYATALFDRKTIERYLGYLHRLLKAMAADDSQEVSRIALLDEGERAQLLDSWNETAAPYPQASTIHGLFEAQVRRTPEAIAVEHEGQQVSYAELNARANRVAHALIGLGVGPDTRVGLCAERSVELVIGLLGILKAGGGYVPLDPSYPQDRLAYMLEDSAPVAVLAQSNTREQLGALSVPVLDLDGPLEEAEHDPQVTGLEPHHLAYVIYTSGSTGRPKGVMVEHRGLSNLLDWYLEDLGLCSDDTVLLVSSYSFDLTQKNILGPLLAGGRLHLAGPFVPDALVAQIRREGITHINLSPSAFHALIDAAGAEGLGGLRRVVLGGEPIQPARLQALPEPRPRFINSYGPTECSDVVAWHALDAELDRYRAASVPLGRSVRNVRLYVLDAHRQPVPTGVAGEIYVGGAGVGRGYRNLPELTGACFLADPFHGEGQARMYKTGDLGRWLANGSLEYLGRSDDQVKLRGFRVELGEIGASLARCDGVREAAVLAREDAPGEQRLVAYYIAEPGAEVEASALRRHMQAQLPEHMVPAAYVRLAHLPLTPNGKLDRKGLPAPDGQAYASTAYEAPQGEVEQTLAGIWQTLLGVERVGRHDDFFALGGHSLQAVRLVAQVRTQLGAELGLTELFAQPSLSAVAQAIVRGQGSALPAITVADRSGPLPLSFAQQRLWFLAQMEGGREAYHIPVGLRLKGELDEDALRRSLDRIVARHEALRTRFEVQEGAAVQRTAPADVGLTLDWVDLSAEAVPEHQLGLQAEAEARAPFDLEQGPLIRGRLVKLGEQEHVLLITMHHIVSDGWSQGVLARELGSLYEAYRSGGEDPLPALPIQYADYAVWQRRWLDGAELQRQGAYWEQALAGAPTLLSLPTDRARPAQQDYAGGSVEVVFDETLSADLKRLSQRHGTTLFMTVLAGWSALLSRLSGQEEVVVGSPVANRTRSEVEGLIGVFVNTLALRVEVGGATVSELLGSVKAKVLEAQTHQDLPFEQVVERVRPVRSLSHSPVFQAALLWQNTEALVLELDGLTIEHLADESYTAKFDLSLALHEHGGRIAGSLDYATALFDRATVERYLGYLQHLLQAMAADDAAEIGKVSLLPEAERHQQIDGWNRTQAAYASASTLPGLVEAQAARTPDAIAVEHGTSKLSYRELDRQANRLAHRLIAQGVAPDARVGLCVERGLPMVIGVLGILKAGGSYVPLDPSYPRDRLAYMLEDSAPVAVVAQSGTRDRLGDRPVAVVDLDDGGWQAEPSHRPEVAGLSSHHAAYVIYTSGSTGRPKGVTVEHRQVVNLLESMRGLLAMTEADRWLAVTTLGFDIAGLELYLPLISGAVVIVLDREASRNAQSLSAALEGSGATVMQATPSTWRLLLESGWSGRPGLKALCGGEALPGELAGRLRARVGRLWNVYGPTETTIWSSAREVDATDAGQGVVPIGRPIANTQMYVLDGHQQPVPLGVTGEIYIGGAGVARGYLNRPELTAERFMENPFHGEGRERMYRTGDLGRWLPDGSLEYQGRADA